MIEKPWEMWLMNTDGPDPDDPKGHNHDRLFEKVGVGQTSCHDTEEEAKAAAVEALRKLKQEVNTGWVACYGEPYVEGPGRVNRSEDAGTKRIDIEDV